MKTFKCHICHETKNKPSDGVTTGYGLNDKNQKVCFECCGIEDQKRMDKSGKYILYLTEDGTTYGKVTNWPGTLSYPVYYRKTGNHNITGKRYDVWFYDHAGNKWWGYTIGDMTQICHVKRIKNN